MSPCKEGLHGVLEPLSRLAKRKSVKDICQLWKQRKLVEEWAKLPLKHLRATTDAFLRYFQCVIEPKEGWIE
uniref:Uncharacterized protein n=1 Tax=Caenorhabditis japonica TaxID=281687 RepID=A0A8R1EUU0_CAEJA